MNLIKCDLACKHQQEGYCQLERPLVTTDYAAAGCIYFTKQQTGKKVKELS